MLYDYYDFDVKTWTTRKDNTSDHPRTLRWFFSDLWSLFSERRGPRWGKPQLSASKVTETYNKHPETYGNWIWFDLMVCSRFDLRKKFMKHPKGGFFISHWWWLRPNFWRVQIDSIIAPWAHTEGKLARPPDPTSHKLKHATCNPFHVLALKGVTQGQWTNGWNNHPSWIAILEWRRRSRKVKLLITLQTYLLHIAIYSFLQSTTSYIAPTCPNILYIHYVCLLSITEPSSLGYN